MKSPGLYNSRILGTGSYLPEKILTNADLEKLVETNDQWIVERTGIRERHIAAPDQATSDLALIASQRALEMAKVPPEEVDAIVFATVTPDQVMPSASCELQAKLKCRKIMAFDLSAACSGFLYGLTIADQFIRTGMYKNVLVVGGDCLSRITDFTDRETCILFGDGAGAVLLARTPSDSDSHILTSHLYAEGDLGHLFTLLGGGSRIPFSPQVLEEKSQFMRMKGREVFKSAVRTMTQCCQEALDSTGVQPEQISWVIPHQANIRIIDAVAKHFGIDDQRVIKNIEHTGNTSAGTIPIAFDEAVRDGRIQRGQHVLLTAFGAGLTSGSLLLRF